MRLAIGITAIGLLAASAQAQGLDKAKLDEARSLIAEAAALGDADARGRVSKPYVAAMRGDIRDGLEKLLKAPGLGGAAKQGLIALDRDDRPTLIALRDQLVALERANGRAD